MCISNSIRSNAFRASKRLILLRICGNYRGQKKKKRIKSFYFAPLLRSPLFSYSSKSVVHLPNSSIGLKNMSYLDVSIFPGLSCDKVFIVIRPLHPPPLPLLYLFRLPHCLSSVSSILPRRKAILFRIEERLYASKKQATLKMGEGEKRRGKTEGKIAISIYLLLCLLYNGV